MSVFYRSIASDIGSISEPLLNLLPTFVNEEPKKIAEINNLAAKYYIEQKDYEKALKYLNSEESIEIEYLYGLQMVENEDYEGALKILDQKAMISLHPEIEQSLSEIKYKAGEQALSRHEYEHAAFLFLTSGYADYMERRNETLYQYAVNLLEKGKNKEAIVQLEKIGDYKDSKQLIIKASVNE